MSRPVTVVSAATADYFDLLAGLVRSLRRGALSRTFALSVLDLGLDRAQADWLKDRGAALVEPCWDLDFPGRDRAPGFFRAMTARPHLPKHFPGHDVYLWIDSDAWVQDDSIFPHFLRAAGRGQLAIVAEIDRGYWTHAKPPKLWGQNQKMFAWAYGLAAGYRLGRHPILNTGVFALARDAPHWRLWSDAHAKALNRRRWRTTVNGVDLRFRLSEQTALNHAVFADKAPATFLPAYCNWFCGKGEPFWDPGSRRLVEPHEPHHPLGIVHLAGKGMKDRVWCLRTTDGGTVETRLTFEAVKVLAEDNLSRLPS